MGFVLQSCGDEMDTWMLYISLNFFAGNGKSCIVMFGIDLDFLFPHPISKC